MNNSKTTLFFSLATLLCFTDISADAKSSIVVISGQKVITDSEAGKAIQAKLQAEQEKLTKPLQEEEKKLQTKAQKLQADEDAIEKDIADFQKNTKILSDESKAKKAEEIQDRKQKLVEDKRDLELKVQKLLGNPNLKITGEVQKVEAKMRSFYEKEMSNFDTLVKEVIKEVAAREGWDIVLMEESLVFVNQNVVKTKMVIEALDKKVKALNQAKKEAAEKATSAKK